MPRWTIRSGVYIAIQLNNKGLMPPQTALQQELDIIKRENRLMATAYYDLASRLQMSNVSLQRRSETNRSFLNRHRQEVNRATSVRSR